MAKPRKVTVPEPDKVEELKKVLDDKKSNTVTKPAIVRRGILTLCK